MIKSVNQLVTQRCNSKCEMCGIWREKSGEEMNPEEFGRLYSHKEFGGVEDLCISGGEPTLRKDLVEVTDRIVSHLPLLRMLFLSTNASNPNMVKYFMKRYSPLVKDIYVCPSLEGDKEIHKKVRGVDTYDRVIETIKKVKSLGLDNSHIVLSTTLTPDNCNQDSLNHIREIAEHFGCTYSFRPSTKSETFYHNTHCNDVSLSIEQINFLRKYMEENRIGDPFLDILFGSLDGEKTIMGDRKTGIECLAGDISVFIKSDGIIYPCINSIRIIGNKEKGVYVTDYFLGDKEDCPCCTECQIYPMLNFNQYASRKNKNVRA